MVIASATPSSTSASHSSNGAKLARLRCERRAERQQLRTSRFDVVTSFFFALILFIGAMVSMMFVAWLTSYVESPYKSIPPIKNVVARGDHAEGLDRDFEPPGAVEVELLTEPTLQDSIEAVTDSVSSVVASLDTMVTNSPASTAGQRSGDSRPPGPESESGDSSIPGFERWQLQFSARDLSSYAAQLDYFGIELAAIGGGVDYVSNLSGSPTKRHALQGDQETRIYFMFNEPSPLQKYDLQLLQAAQVQVTGRVPVKFIPQDLEDRLALVELEYAKTKGHPFVSEIAKTIFECRVQGGGYEFVIVEQRYRSGR